MGNKKKGEEEKGKERRKMRGKRGKVNMYPDSKVCRKQIILSVYYQLSVSKKATNLILKLLLSIKLTN